MANVPFYAVVILTKRIMDKKHVKTTVFQHFRQSYAHSFSVVHTHTRTTPGI